MTGLRWGVLAPGGIARSFARAAASAGITIVAAGSRREESARAYADEFGIPRAYGSYDELVADPEVDIVYIASPHSHHREQALLALAAGKHVLIEKPLTLTAAEAEQIQDAATAGGLLAMEAMWTRYLPHMIRIREIIAAGTLGEVRTLIADHTQSLPSDPTHRLNDLSLGGGALLDLGIYPVSFAVGILGPVETVAAAGHLGATGADTEVAISLTHRGGGVSSLVTSSRAVGPNVAHIIGTEARIEIDRIWYTPTSFRVIAHDGTELEHFDSPTSPGGLSYQARYAEECVAQGRRDSELLPLDESVEIMRLLDEIRRQIGVRYPQEG